MDEITLTDKEQKARRRVCLALDGIQNSADALKLVSELAPYVGMVKIGKELHTIAGMEGVNIVGEVFKRQTETFLDLKFHDTPATVYQASRAATQPGVNIFNVHVAGGETMCKRAFEGAYKASEERKIERPKVIGVTVLTSLNNDDLDTLGYGYQFDTLVKRNTELALKWGLDGIVCPANKAGDLSREFGNDFLYVTPGIEFGGKSGDGQKQLYTPENAVRDCKSSVLVIGSAITKAQDRKVTAYDILKSMAPHL